MAGLANSVVSGPVEHIRTRLQVQTASASSTLTYRGPWDCICKIYQSHGIAGLYKGQVATAWRETFGYGAYFLTYEWLVQRAIAKGGISRDQLPATQVCVYGALAGFAMWGSVYPIDVIKSKLQTDQLGRQSRRYQSILDCARQTLRHEGVAGFYKGITPCLLRAAPANAATFIGFELAMRVLHAAHNINTHTAQYQGLTIKNADELRACEINCDVARRLILKESDFVQKITGVSSIGEYDRVAREIEALLQNGSSDPRRLALCNKAREWFDSERNSPSGRREALMYPQLKAFLYLIALHVRDIRGQTTRRLWRYLLPHQKSNVKGEPTTRKRHDIVVCWQEPDPDSGSDKDMYVVEESDAFLACLSSTGSTPNQVPTPSNVHDSTRKLTKKERQEEAVRERFWHCFGVIECKLRHNMNHEVKDHGQLGWYVCAALEAVFERNNIWGWIVSGTNVRFVFFAHGAVVTSDPISVETKEGRQMFIDNFIRLCLCPPYRAGFDPTKRWLEDQKRWEVKCFNSTNSEKGEPVLAYVHPIPFKTHGGLFGRRTRCHYATLTQFTKDGKVNEAYDCVLKESWAELDVYSKESKTMNTESLPNEVRVFQQIQKCGDSPVPYALPTLMAGGSVRISDHSMSDLETFSTVIRYLGELDIVGHDYNVQPPTPTAITTDTGAAKVEPPFRVVNRVHQRLLMSPIGKPMTWLPIWVREILDKKKIKKEKESILLSATVGYFFARLFWVIFYLYKHHGVYHRDLSEGNVLVHEVNGKLLPLLIDFDHARLCSDNVDNMRSRTGTVPFMSILNLAGRSNSLSIVDELESLLYLWVWKFTIGFSQSDITRSKSAASSPQSISQASTASQQQNLPSLQQAIGSLQINRVTRDCITSHRSTAPTQEKTPPATDTKQPSVRQWAQGDPGTDCLNAKFRDTATDASFSKVLAELKPEFVTYRTLFLELRRALFDWDGQQASYLEEKTSEDGIQMPEDLPLPEDGNEGEVEYLLAFGEVRSEIGKRSASAYRANEEAYYKRLKSRSDVADDILEKFKVAIRKTFPNV
ncbi:Mitochondrial carrier protein ymc2 [Dispira parvispora]|uniref:Mitochondrial carrier protein ymc2 n=1 Tax=Dispira parvispora TaxID=1520584 RepID=A0A9W8ASH1_9FUNG|nr:Mitochondrial carrier protein ymc2 [Dispira parvispora]